MRGFLRDWIDFYDNGFFQMGNGFDAGAAIEDGVCVKLFSPTK